MIKSSPFSGISVVMGKTGQEQDAIIVKKPNDVEDVGPR